MRLGESQIGLSSHSYGIRAFALAYRPLEGRTQTPQTQFRDSRFQGRSVGEVPVEGMRSDAEADGQGAHIQTRETRSLDLGEGRFQNLLGACLRWVGHSSTLYLLTRLLGRYTFETLKIHAVYLGG